MKQSYKNEFSKHKLVGQEGVVILSPPQIHLLGEYT